VEYIAKRSKMSEAQKNKFKKGSHSEEYLSLHVICNIILRSVVVRWVTVF